MNFKRKRKRDSSDVDIDDKGDDENTEIDPKIKYATKSKRLKIIDLQENTDESNEHDTEMKCERDEEKEENEELV